MRKKTTKKREYLRTKKQNTKHKNKTKKGDKYKNIYSTTMQHLIGFSFSVTFCKYWNIFIPAQLSD